MKVLGIHFIAVICEELLKNALALATFSFICKCNNINFPTLMS